MARSSKSGQASSAPSRNPVEPFKALTWLAMPTRWLADYNWLSLAERGALWSLCLLKCQLGDIPCDDVRQLARLTFTDYDEFAEHWSAVQPVFEDPALQAYLAAEILWFEQQRTSGAKGGRERARRAALKHAHIPNVSSKPSSEPSSHPSSQNRTVQYSTEDPRACTDSISTEEPRAARGALSASESPRSSRPAKKEHRAARGSPPKERKTKTTTLVTPSFAQLCALVKAEREAHPEDSGGDFVESVKRRCAAVGFRYTTELIWRALDAVEAAARRQREKRHHGVRP